LDEPKSWIYPSPSNIDWMQLTLISNLIVCVLEFWLDNRQIKALINRGQQIPDPLMGLIDPVFFRLNSDLNLRRLYFSRIENVFGFMLESIVLFSGTLVTMYDYTIYVLENIFNCGPENYVITGVVFILVVSLFSTAIKFPIECYRILFIEIDPTNPADKLQVLLHFIEDQFKSFVASILFGIPIIGVTIRLFNAKFPFQWLITSTFICLITFYFSDIYADVLHPFLETITPLNDSDKRESELKSQIQQFAKKLGFSLDGVYKMNSPHSHAHSNVIMMGFGSKKKIVIYDNLINKLSTAEILAIVGHEIGHSKFSHNWIKLLVQAVFVGNFITFFFHVVKHKAFYLSFGFQNTDHSVGFVLFSYFYGSLMSIVGILSNFISRRLEYSADTFALNNNLPVESALIKLHAITIANIMPDKVYSVYHYSHPSLMERLHRIEAHKNKMK